MNRFLRASFKGKPFLVRTSNEEFGQKTILHEYPNANRTEVEFLGNSSESFSLEMVIQGNDGDYISKRNDFKRILLQNTPGILVHPIDGAIKVSVVGKARLTEDYQGSLGVATFSVTFVKFFDPLFPSETLNNVPFISNLTNQLLGGLSTDIADNFSVALSGALYDFGLAKVNSFAVVFQNAIDTINKNDVDISELNEQLTKFIVAIPTLITVPEDLGSDMNDLFTTIDLISPTEDNQLRMLKEFYEFGDDDDKSRLRDTFSSRIASANDNYIENMTRLASLGLSYKTASVVDYNNRIELDNIYDTLETQYLKIINTAGVMSDDTRQNLQNLRNEFRQFRDQKSQEIFDVVDVDIPTNEPITKVAYSYYGNTDLDQNILDLNDLTESVFVQGGIKVLSDE